MSKTLPQTHEVLSIRVEKANYVPENLLQSLVWSPKKRHES